MVERIPSFRQPPRWNASAERPFRCAYSFTDVVGGYAINYRQVGIIWELNRGRAYRVATDHTLRRTSENPPRHNPELPPISVSPAGDGDALYGMPEDERVSGIRQLRIQGPMGQIRIFKLHHMYTFMLTRSSLAVWSVSRIPSFQNHTFTSTRDSR